MHSPRRLRSWRDCGFAPGDELGRFGSSPQPVGVTPLLAGWAATAGSCRGGRAVQADIELDAQVHLRRCVLQGVSGGVEVQWAWGLCHFADSPAGWRLPAQDRAVRRTEVSFNAVHLIKCSHSGVVCINVFEKAFVVPLAPKSIT